MTLRRAMLLSSFTGAIVLGVTLASVSSNKAGKIQSFKEKLSDIAFCQKGYEIASSFPSYNSRSVTNIRQKIDMLRDADMLQAKSDRLIRMINGVFRDEANSLGIEGQEYQEILQDITTKAELEAVMSYNSTEEPIEFLGQLDAVCSSRLTQ